MDDEITFPVYINLDTATLTVDQASENIDVPDGVVLMMALLPEPDFANEDAFVVYRDKLTADRQAKNNPAMRAFAFTEKRFLQLLRDFESVDWVVFDPRTANDDPDPVGLIVVPKDRLLDHMEGSL